MTETEENERFLTDAVMLGRSNSYHLYEQIESQPRAAREQDIKPLERLCNAEIDGKNWKTRDALVEVPEKEIRENEGKYCEDCLTESEDYDD